MRNGHITAGLACISILSACAAATRPPVAPTPVATFDFTPQGCVTPGVNKLIFAIVAPAWQNKSIGNATKVTDGEIIPLQARFTQALRDDFLELVTCRGFVTKGPFNAFDDMVFPDRDGLNLLLEPIVEANVQYTDVHKVAFCKGGFRAILCTADALSNSAPTEFSVNGTLVFSGRVTLSLKEPVTNSRMWTKSIDIGTTSVPFHGTIIYNTALANNPDFRKDAGLLNALTPKMEEIYRAVLTVSDRYLDPVEMKLVSAQAADVKKRGAITVPRF